MKNPLNPHWNPLKNRLTNPQTLRVQAAEVFRALEEAAGEALQGGRQSQRQKLVDVCWFKISQMDFFFKKNIYIYIFFSICTDCFVVL